MQEIVCANQHINFRSVLHSPQKGTAGMTRYRRNRGRSLSSFSVRSGAETLEVRSLLSALSVGKSGLDLPQPAPQQPEYVSDELLVQFTPQVTSQQAKRIAESFGLQVSQTIHTATMQHFGDGPMLRVATPVGSQLQQYINRLQQHPGIPRQYIHSVAAGEASGTLPQVLQRLTEQLESRAALQRQLRSALTYPAVVIVLALSVTWQAWAQGAPHLFVTALIALVFKAIVIPISLERIIAMHCGDCFAPCETKRYRKKLRILLQHPLPQRHLCARRRPRARPRPRRSSPAPRPADGRGPPRNSRGN
mgnify:CR=1 FL=1